MSIGPQIELVCLGVGRDTTMAFDGKCSSSFIVQDSNSKIPILLVGVGLGVVRQYLKLTKNLPERIYLSSNDPDQAGELRIFIKGLFDKNPKWGPIEIFGQKDVLQEIREKRLYIYDDKPHMKIKFISLLASKTTLIYPKAQISLKVVQGKDTNQSYGFIMYYMNTPILGYTGTSPFIPRLYNRLSKASTIVCDARLEETPDHATFSQVAAFKEGLSRRKQIYITHYGTQDNAPSVELEMDGVFGLKPNEVISLSTKTIQDKFNPNSSLYFFDLFESKTCFYIVGQDRSRSTFAILSIDRTNKK